MRISSICWFTALKATTACTGTEARSLHLRVGLLWGGNRLAQVCGSLPSTGATCTERERTRRVPERPRMLPSLESLCRSPPCIWLNHAEAGSGNPVQVSFMGGGDRALDPPPAVCLSRVLQLRGEPGLGETGQQVQAQMTVVQLWAGFPGSSAKLYTNKEATRGLGAIVS